MNHSWQEAGSRINQIINCLEVKANMDGCMHARLRMSEKRVHPIRFIRQRGGNISRWLLHRPEHEGACLVVWLQVKKDKDSLAWIWNQKRRRLGKGRVRSWENLQVCLEISTKARSYSTTEPGWSWGRKTVSVLKAILDLPSGQDSVPGMGPWHR